MESPLPFVPPPPLLLPRQQQQQQQYADPSAVVASSVWAMWAVASVFLGLRWYCRTARARAVWWDDWLLTAGWVFLTAASATITELMRRGFGTTLAFHPETHVLSTTTDVLNKCALGLTKTSFAVTLLRVAGGWQRPLIWALLLSMNALLAANAVTTWMAACDRVGKDHYQAVLPGACWGVVDSVIIAMVSSSYSAIVDFILAFLPWKIVMSLKMNKREKVGVAVAMSLGCLAGLIGIMKIYKMTTIQTQGDIPYHLSLVFVWGQAEPSATIVASSIPVLRVLCRDIHHSSRYGHSRTRSSGGEYLKSTDYYKHNSARWTSMTGHSKSGSVVTATTTTTAAAAGARGGPAVLSHVRASHSDRSLLPGRRNGGGSAVPSSRHKNDIMLTREIQVDVEYDHGQHQSQRRHHHGSCYYDDGSGSSFSSDPGDAPHHHHHQQHYRRPSISSSSSRHYRHPSQGTLTRFESFEMDTVPPPYPAYSRPRR